MPSRRQPKDVRRAQILEAALAACAEKGYHATRIDDIAERAGLSKGAVYHHFDSKQSVFVGVLDQMMAEFSQLLVAAEAAHASVADTLRRVLALTATMTGQPEMAGAMFDLFLLGAREDAFRDRIVHHYQDILAACTRLFQRGVDTGELRPELDPEAAARGVVMSLDGIILDHLVMDEPTKLASTLTTFGEVVLGGLLRPTCGGDS